MKMQNKSKELLALFNTQMEELRAELRERISHGSLDPSWKLEVLDYILVLTQLDPETFHKTWIDPLLRAGLSCEIAIACIAESYILPN